MLVTSPVGETISNLIRNGLFGVEEALRCCHDCLSALAAAASAGIRHGDIQPENVIRVNNGSRHPYFVLIGWGHAILEDRDRPVMNLFFSSTFALQEGKLCGASDAESLIYLLYFSCGGVCPELDSVESALQWRETSWSRRVIQQKLGDISAVLKAFADYVDSLCGTPYPMDYEIWLKRLRRTINEDHGKEVDTSSSS
jgi:serine/threonine protein kinase